MPLTPADVHNVAFSKPPIGKRGYNEDEVDQFLDLVEDTLAQLQDENEQLRAGAGASAAPVASNDEIRRSVEKELRREYEAKLADAQDAAKNAQAEADRARAEAQKARAEVIETQKKAVADVEAARAEATRAAEANAVANEAPANVGGDGMASAETHMQAARVLGMAQEMADRLTSEAQSESRAMLSDARSSAEKQLADADAQSKAQLEDARAKASQMVAEAEQKAAQTTSDANARAEAQIKQAEEKAAALQADAERKHTDIMNTVKKQQAALEGRIAELRTFEREYRTRLKTLLQSQLEELDSRGSSAPMGDSTER